MEIKEIEEGTLSIVPFDSEVVGADSKYVFIKEKSYIESNDNILEKYILLKVKKTDFIKMISSWLETKADFCKRYDHFCGVFGNFYIDTYKKVGETNLLTGFDEENEDVIYTNVPIYEVLSFDNNCDMEHG